MTIPILILYAAILFGFGYIVSVRLLKENNSLAVAGFTAILGLAAYMVLANALAYLLPIKTAFIAGLVVMAGAALILQLRASKPSTWITPPRAVVIILSCLALLIGFTQARIFPSDFLSWSHGPLVSTMAEGNFPPHGPFAPWGRLRYHYGPEVLAASLVSLAKISPLDAYGPQPLFSAFGLVFLVGALVYGWTKSWRTATFASVLAMAGGGWIWFNVTYLVSDLFHHFILGEKIIGPFRALSFMGVSPIANPIAIWFVHRSSALGFAFLYGLLYCTVQAVPPSRQRIAWILTGTVFGAALGLTMETGLLVFGVASVAFLGYLLLARLTDRAPLRSWTNTAIILVVILGITSIITLVQGGMLSPVGGGASAGSLRPHLTTYFDPWGARRIFIWEWMFIRDFGLPLLLMPLTAWFCYKKRDTQPWYGLVFFIGFTYICVPILTQFAPRHYETLRLFWGATSFSSLLIGIMLCEWMIEKHGGWKRLVGWLAVLSMLGSASVWLLLTAVFPDHQVKRSPLFVTMEQLPPLPPGSRELFEWTKANTAPKDYFYVRPNYEQIIFTTVTGRTAIAPLYGDDFPPSKLSLVLDFEGNCTPATLRELGAMYLVVMHEERVDWFSRICNPADWKTVYDGRVEGAAVPVVFTPR